MNADRIIAAGLDSEVNGPHPLAGWVHTATALARLGDPQPLLGFIDRALADDDTAEAANLNYWALWLRRTAGAAA